MLSTGKYKETLKRLIKEEEEDVSKRRKLMEKDPTSSAYHQEFIRGSADYIKKYKKQLSLEEEYEASL